MYQISFDNPISVYFIGIGGISMSGLALVLADRGFRVSGSDRSESEATAELEKAGIKVNFGQRAENIDTVIKPDLVVYTAAIHPDNPEFAAAKKLGIPMLTRAELLGQIMQHYNNLDKGTSGIGKNNPDAVSTCIYCILHKFLDN